MYKGNGKMVQKPAREPGYGVKQVWRADIQIQNGPFEQIQKEKRKEKDRSATNRSQAAGQFGARL